MPDSNTYFAGVNWPRHKHCVHLATAAGQRVGVKFFPHRGEGLREMADWLRAECGTHDVIATMEVPHGPVVTSLQHDGFTVQSINPTGCTTAASSGPCPVRRMTCETLGS